MRIVLFILSGILSGIIGGMGMGGGCVLIPFLTLLLSVSQKLAQGYNLLVFIPTAIIALVLHFKNKLLYFDKKLFLFIIPGLAFSVGFSFLSQLIKGLLLAKLFSIFLLITSIYEFYLFFNPTNKKNS